MNLKIIITKHSDPTYLVEQEFNHFPLILGREDSSNVVLIDPFKIISRKHAKIIDTEGILQIVDLNSANFTYLNDQKLEPNEEFPIKSGDKIKIGEYELKTELIREKEIVAIKDEDDQRTMVFSSPYKEEIANIEESITRIVEKFTSDESPLKSDSLKFSLTQAFTGSNKNEVNKIIAEFFAENFLEKEFHFAESNVNFTGSRQELKPSVSTKPAAVETGGVQYQDYSFTSHFGQILDNLLDTFSKLIQGFLHFRQEFFGVTVFYTIPTSSLNELKEYLFNPEISPEEEKKRIHLFKEETEKLLSHQLGMLEGYRHSITEGSKALLQSMDPEFVEKEIESKSSGIDLGKILSGTRKTKILDAIKENYRKYISDPYHIEKKFFRPLFLKGYQKRISSKSQSEF